MERNLPPLNAIKAFEAAARHLNLTHAAEELGVTQGAISKQVIALEDYIGTKLFERAPNGLVLTDEGRSIRETVTPAFEMLGQTFTRFSRRPPRSNVFRISTVASFAAFILVSRLDDFEKALPGIELELLTSDRLVDLSSEEVDLSIRYGRGVWDGVVSRPLVTGLLVPVCGPSMLPNRENSSVPENLAYLSKNSRRLQVFSNNEWTNWTAQTGVEVEEFCRSMIVEDFLVAVSTILCGQGFGLVPEILVREHLREGRLVRFATQNIVYDQTYHIAHAANAEQRPIVKKVIDWLEMQVT